jgi:hypothetical protein
MTFPDLLPHRWSRFKDASGPSEDSTEKESPNGGVQHQKDDQSSSSIGGNPKPLKQYTRRMNPQSQSALCQLPFEILDPIIKQLPASSATTLALTCKGLWNIRREEHLQRLRQDSGQRAFFLSLLGDHSAYLPCWSCLVLHRYGDKKKDATSSGPHGLKLCSNIEANSLLVPGCPHYGLSYMDLQLALRGARLGLEHGTTLRNHHCTTNGHHSKTIEREIILTHRIIDRRLFLKQEFRIRAPLDRKKQERDKHALVPLVPHPTAPSLGCPHSQKSLANLAASAIAHHQLQQHLRSPSPPCIYPLNQTPPKNQEPPRSGLPPLPEQLPLCPSTSHPCDDQTHLVHQCRYCATDFHVSVLPLPGDPKHCTLILTAYKDIGPSSPIQPSPLPPRNPNNPTHTYFHTNLWPSHTSSSFATGLDRRNPTVFPYTTISLKHVWESRTTTHPGANAVAISAILHPDYIRPVGYGNGGGLKIGSNGCEVLQWWKYDRWELAQATEWREMGFWAAERDKWRETPENRARRILKGLGYCFWCCCLCGWRRMDII